MDGSYEEMDGQYLALNRWTVNAIEQVDGPYSALTRWTVNTCAGRVLDSVRPIYVIFDSGTLSGSLRAKMGSVLNRWTLPMNRWTVNV